MIANGHVVSFLYTLTDDNGDVLDASGDEPLSYLHGAHGIVPGLENALTGKKTGDRFDTVIAPEDGYGDLEPDAQVSAPRAEFPKEVELETGMAIMLEDEDGNPQPVWVIEITDDEVVLDKNHPLAGVTLHFAIEVVDVRDATDEERTHGHVHGHDGHDDHHGHGDHDIN